MSFADSVTESSIPSQPFMASSQADVDMMMKREQNVFDHADYFYNSNGYADELDPGLEAWDTPNLAMSDDVSYAGTSAPMQSRSSTFFDDIDDVQMTDL